MQRKIMTVEGENGVNVAYNVDCMEYMRSLPDNFFSLAVVDPPYGDALSTPPMGDRGTASADGSTGTKWNRFGQRFDRYKYPPQHLGSAEPEERGQKSTVKKLLRGTQRLERNTLKNFSVSHATRSSGAAITLSSRRQDAFWYGAN